MDHIPPFSHCVEHRHISDISLTYQKLGTVSYLLSFAWFNVSREERGDGE